MRIISKRLCDLSSPLIAQEALNCLCLQCSELICEQPSVDWNFDLGCYTDLCEHEQLDIRGIPGKGAGCCISFD